MTHDHAEVREQQRAVDALERLAGVGGDAGRTGDVHGQPVGAVGRRWPASGRPASPALVPAVRAEVERDDDLRGLPVLRTVTGPIDLAVQLVELRRTRRRRRRSSPVGGGEPGRALVDDHRGDRVRRAGTRPARRAPGSTRRCRAATTSRRSSRAPVSLPASGPATATTTSQKSRTTYFVRRPVSRPTADLVIAPPRKSVDAQRYRSRLRPHALMRPRTSSRTRARLGLRTPASLAPTSALGQWWAIGHTVWEAAVAHTVRSVTAEAVRRRSRQFGPPPG